MDVTQLIDELLRRKPDTEGEIFELTDEEIKKVSIRT
jgi:hypothetical protein